MWWGVTSPGKSVSPWTQQGFEYGRGGEISDPNQTNVDNGILNVSENFETGENGKVLGIVDIHVDDLLISGSSEFTEYISWKIKVKSDVGICGENKATYSGAKTEKVSDSGPDGLISEPPQQLRRWNQPN